MAPNGQLRYNSTIILVIHYHTHSDPYTKKDNFSICLLNQFISKQEVVTDIILIEILQVLRPYYCSYSFTKTKNFHFLKIPNLMFRAFALHHSLSRRVSLDRVRTCTFWMDEHTHFRNAYQSKILWYCTFFPVDVSS